MSNRVQKSSSSHQRPNQREGRESLAFFALSSGFEVMPCSSCFRRKEKCIMAEGLSRCQNCILHKRQCDGSGIPIDSLQNIVREQDRLKREETLAEERLLRSQHEMNEAIARLQRLKKLQEFLRHRGKEMAERGLQSLEELEAEEEQERQAAQAPAAGSSEMTADPGIGVENDWSLNGFDWGAIPADPSGVVGEIFSEGAERSSSA